MRLPAHDVTMTLPLPLHNHMLGTLLGDLEEILLEIEPRVLNVRDDCNIAWVSLGPPLRPPRRSSSWSLGRGQHIPSSPEAGWGFFFLANSAFACSISFCLCWYSCLSCSALWVARIVRWWENP